LDTPTPTLQLGNKDNPTSELPQQRGAGPARPEGLLTEGCSGYNADALDTALCFVQFFGQRCYVRALTAGGWKAPRHEIAATGSTTQAPGAIEISRRGESGEPLCGTDARMRRADIRSVPLGG
jgi:hypothetical protein